MEEPLVDCVMPINTLGLLRHHHHYLEFHWILFEHIPDIEPLTSWLISNISIADTFEEHDMYIYT